MSNAIAIDRIATHMQLLERIINREQVYIAMRGVENDANPDTQWVEYARDAQQHLDQWDELKVQRDALKVAVAA